MCSICRQNPCNCRCPNFKSIGLGYICSICGEEIQLGEKFLTNKDNEYVHYECLSDIKWLLNWLNVDIKGE